MKNCPFMKNIFLFIFIVVSIPFPAQEKKSERQILDLYNDTLKSILKELYSAETDKEKEIKNALFINSLEKSLLLPNSYTYPFDSLNDIARLSSPDQSFRIYNWNIPWEDGTHSYYGFIQKKQIIITKKGMFKKEKHEHILLFPLIDKSASVRNEESYVSDNKKWLGMLYYKIIPKKTKNKTFYTLLAWDGNNKFSSKKIIDVLTFAKNGTPSFGNYLFNMNKLHQKRVIFEYSKLCSMSLKYDEKKESIIFDHLIPTQPQLEGQFQYYCPDLGCDGFGFKRGRWNFETDITATNEKNENDKHYVHPLDKNIDKKSDTFSKDAKPKKRRK